MSREGGIPHEVVRQEWLADMATELRRMVKTFERTGRGAKDLLEALVVAEREGVDATVLAEIRRELGQTVKKRRVA
jgi:septum formation topological specificity factor MinE